MALTDVKIRSAKPQGKPYKLSDSGGLFLLIATTGSKYWRLKYRFEKREKVLALGVYPIVSLAEAREKRDLAKRQIANGVDPNVVKKESKRAPKVAEESSFEYIAREWHIKNCQHWSPNHKERVIRRLELYIFPWLGSVPISGVSAPRLLEALRRVEAKGAIETAHRVLSICGQVFRYGIATGRAERNPTESLRGALEPVKVTHFASILEPAKIGELLRVIDGYKGSLVTKYALKLLPLIFVRPGELRCLEWGWVDLEKAEINIPAERMKMREPLLVPLSTQVVEILKELCPLTGNGLYVFPGAMSKSRPISDNTINAALKRLDYASGEMTAHGWRSIARTHLDESLGFRPDIIEQQLGHGVRDPLGRAYNRTSHLLDRRKMMQAWGDWLYELKSQGTAAPL